MATQHKSLNALDPVTSVRDTYQVLLSVPSADDETRKDFALVDADVLKDYMLGTLQVDTEPTAAAGLDNKSTLSLTEDMYFSLRLTATNGYRYWSVKPLLDALATVQQREADEVVQEAEIQALSQQVSTLDASLQDVTVKLTQVIQSTSDPDAMFGPQAREYLNEQFLSRDALMPYQSVVLGQRAGEYCGNLGASVLVGKGAGLGALNAFKDYVAIGAYAQPLNSRTVTLGNTKTQTFAARSVATRADARDFEVQDLSLGLDFVLKLHPKLATMDLREDYIAYADMPYPPEPIAAPPVKPAVDAKHPGAATLWAAYRADLAAWTVANDAYQKALDAWRPAYADWKKANSLTTIVPDGSQKQTHSQSLLLADDVLAAAQQVGSFFTGVENSKLSGGMDVKSLRVEEMVPVLVKAIQELHALLHSDDVVEAVAARLFEKQQAAREALRSP